MSDGCEKFWENVPEKAVQPVRVKLLEALRTIGEPLSAVQLVDVLDGDVNMWEAARHLRALRALGIVKQVKASRNGEQPREDGFDAPYGLVERKTGEDG